jgi:hypothetical protein
MMQTECGIETRRDGTEICSLHKHALDKMTAFDEIKNGVYEEWKAAFFCSVGNKDLTAPLAWAQYLSGDKGKAIFGPAKHEVCRVEYRIRKCGQGWHGWVWHAEGHPYWHPIALLRSEPFILMLEDGRRLKVVLRTVQGVVEATGQFF